MKPATLRFAAFVMSEPVQQVLSRFGFDPVARAEQPSPSHAIWVQRGVAPPVMLAPEQLAAPKAVDPAKAGEPIRSIVRVTAEDGYVAAFSLAEMAPQFANRPIQLAQQMNGAALPGQALRLVVPGESRAARSVRDVVRIDID